MNLLIFIAASVAAGTFGPSVSDTLQAVTVTADRGMTVSRTDTVRTNSPVSVTDAFASIPNVYIADYGGAASQKSISLRGMGSPHAAIYLDGVRVGNVQSGQADLGMFDLRNSGAIVIDYAQNSISFNTAKPVFGTRPFSGAVRFRGGSFGTYEPSARLDFRLTDKLSLSATAGGLLSRGDFPLADGSARQNNDIRQIRAGLDSWGIMDGGNFHAKAYYNGARRGTPGTLAWPLTDRQKDHNALVQAVVHERFSPLYSLSASAKASFDHLEYLSEWGNNFYRHAEAQLNSAHKFNVCRWMDACICADLAWNSLSSDSYNASRTSLFATASAAFHPGRIKADIALEYAGISDTGGQRRDILSPSADLRWMVAEGFDIHAFARRAYRTPTFNELYYPGYGNPLLKAEDASLTGIGAEYRRPLRGNWHILAKTDGFFNYLKNKIISAPTDFDPAIMLPYNVGVVRMAGADVTASAKYRGRIFNCGLSARYAYQNAIDRTPGSASFGRQIPYISKHSVVLGADASCRGWVISLIWNSRGGRYDSNGRMPDYNTLDLTAGKDICLKEGLALGLKFISRNLNDSRYELLSGYPLPGRSFYGEIDFKF